MKNTQRAYYKKFHPDLDRDRLQGAGKVSIDDRNLERLSAAGANYMYDVPAEFEPPKAWDWRLEVPLKQQMKRKRTDWLVREVGKIWRDCGGKGSGAYSKSETKEKYTGALIELLVELLDQFGAPRDNRSRHALFRLIKDRDKATGRRRR